jgi:hypothetical protein
MVCGWEQRETGYPRFDSLSTTVAGQRAQLEPLESRIRSGKLPATDETVLKQLEATRRQLAVREPHHRPELQRYWSEQGRTRAQADLAEGRLRLFYVVGPPQTSGPLPFRVPPLDEFEALLRERQPGFWLERMSAPRSLGEEYYEVNSLCDGYNEEVERHFREQHGFDMVSMLWRMAKRDAWGPQLSTPDWHEVWLPFAASGASSGLFAWLVLIRRRRERCLLQQASDANAAVR